MSPIKRIPEVQLGTPRVETHEEQEARGIVPRSLRSDGKPYIWLPDGSKRVLYSRPSGYGDVLDDKTMLHHWRERTILEGLAVDPSLAREYAGLRARHPLPWDFKVKQLVQDVANRALDAAGADNKATLGTQLHEITEAIDMGREVGWVPEDFKPVLRAYVAAMKEAEEKHGLRIIDAEVFVVNDEERIGGRLDRLVEWEGEVLVADIKTSQTLDYSRGKFCIQIGSYASSVRYDPALALRGIDPLFNGMYNYLGVGRSPLVKGVEVSQEKALIIHFPSGGSVCSIVPIDIRMSRVGRELVREVKEWRNFWNRKAQKALPVIEVDGAEL